MKPNTYTVISFMVLLVNFGCNNPVSKERDHYFSSSFDTLEVNITAGTSMKLTGLHDSYDFGQRLQGQIILTNNSDTGAFAVVFPIWPGYKFYVYDENFTYSGGGPNAVSFSEIRYRLLPGQSYTYDVYWYLGTFAQTPGGYMELPAYAGTYWLHFYLSGNENFYDKYLTKRITITETGEQILTVLKNTYDQYDLAILNFVMRNRFATPTEFVFADSAVAQLVILGNASPTDTLFFDSISFPNKIISVQGKKDTLLFSYRLNKTQSSLLGLNGAFPVFASFVFQQRTFRDSTYVQFLSH